MAYTTTPGIPSAFQQATNENYVSSLSIHKPEVAEDFVNRYGDQSLMGLLDAIGAKAPVAQKTFSHWEDDYLHQNFKLQTAATITQAGVKVVVATGYTSDGTGDGKVFLRVGDIVMNSVGEMALVTIDDDTAGHDEDERTLVCYGAEWAAQTTTSETLIIVGNEFAEGTGQPKGITPNANEYTNSVAIMKESFEVTGSEATNKVWFEVTDPNTGERGYLWYIKGEADTYKRFMNYCETQMLLGQKATNTNAALPGTIDKGGITGTEGLIEFIKSGNQQSYNQLSGFNLSDFDAMIRKLDTQRGSKENMMFCGIDLSLAIDDAVAAMFAGGGINYGSFNGAEEIAVAFGFNSFTRGGYTFHKKVYDPFNYSPMMGADGYNYAGMGMVIPGDSGRDSKTREAIPSLRIRYKAAEGYSREMEHWLTGSAGLAQATNDEDNMKCHYRTERGFEGFANNRFMLIERV
jgi:hypothetical protein